MAVHRGAKYVAALGRADPERQFSAIRQEHRTGRIQTFDKRDFLIQKILIKGRAYAEKNEERLILDLPHGNGLMAFIAFNDSPHETQEISLPLLII